MQELSEMIHFVHEHERYQGKIFPSKNQEQDSADIFYDKVLSGEFESEEQAAEELFGRKDHRYKRLKKKVVDGLVNSVFVIEPHAQNLPNSSRKYYSLIREIAVAKIMMGKGMHKVAFFFARRSYRKAMNFGFYDIMYDAVWVMKYYYGIILQRETEFRKYTNKLKDIRDILNLENKSYSYYAELLMLHKKNRVSLEEYYQLASKRFSDLSSYISTIDSSRFQITARLIRIIKYAALSDFSKMLSSTEDDIEYFTVKNQGHSNALYIFLIHKTKACIRLGKYQQGLATIQYTLQIIDDRNLNWFPLKYNEFFILMQSGKYKDAQKIYFNVTSHKRYDKLASYMKEDWVTGGAYLNYIIETGKLEPHSKFKFKLGKFLNEVPEYSKDRRVKNIPILIAQIIFMIYRKQTGKVIDRMDAIKQYCGRNLRYNEAVRSNSFIMALMEIPKQSFNKIAVERHITRFTKRLEEVPIHLSGKNFDLEIIPYERLLEYVLEDL